MVFETMVSHDSPNPKSPKNIQFYTKIYKLKSSEETCSLTTFKTYSENNSNLQQSQMPSEATVIIYSFTSEESRSEIDTDGS